MIEIAKFHHHNFIVIFWLCIQGRQFHTNIVAGEAMHGSSARSLLEEHLGLLTDILGIEGLRLAVGEVEQTLTAHLFLLLRHHVWNLQGRRAGTLGIGKNMQLGDRQFIQETVGLFEALGRLTATAHHHVHADKGIGHLLLDAQNLVGKQLAVVVAMHQSEHGVAATLQGDVEMGHKGTTLMRTIVDEFVAEQVGFEAADAVATDTLNGIEGSDQVDEALASGLAEVTDIDARQHNLLATLFDGLPRLIDQRGDGGIATEPTSLGDGAVGAVIVTAVLHLQEIAGAVATRTTGGKRRDVLGLLYIVGHTALACPATAPCIREELQQVGFLVGAQHQVNTFYLTDSLGLQLRIAARHHHKGTRMLTHHSVNGLATLVVGHLGHRTSVNQADVGLLVLSRRAHPTLLKHLPEGRRLGEVQFASEGKIGCRLALKSRCIYHIYNKVFLLTPCKGTNK